MDNCIKKHLYANKKKYPVLHHFASKLDNTKGLAISHVGVSNLILLVTTISVVYQNQMGLYPHPVL